MTRKAPHFRIVLIAAIAALVLVPTALAGKPAHGGSGSISLAPLVYDANGNGLPNWGDTVTFNVSTTATSEPFVDLQCYQSGALVLHASAGFFPWALNKGYDFTLNSGMWAGGAADCTATLGMYNRQGRWQALASTSFHADA